MSEFYEMIKEGLEQALEYEKGNKAAARSKTVFSEPPPNNHGDGSRGLDGSDVSSTVPPNAPNNLEV